ncbi:MAG: hypothetical protein K8R85_02955 [Bacteroidetes bacterium]|nr:hypothetical protein [Bacteroidota bacterium]
MKQMLFTGWNFMRWLRLGLGIFIAIQAIQNHDTLSGFISAFFLFQAVTNTGCCSSGGCSVPSSKKNFNKIEDVKFEKIKTKV